MKGKIQPHPLQGLRPTYEINPELWDDDYVLDFAKDDPVFYIQNNGKRAISVFETWISYTIGRSHRDSTIHFDRTDTVIDKLIGKIGQIKNGQSDFFIMETYWTHHLPEFILDFDIMVYENWSGLISIFASNEADAMEMKLRL